MFEGWRDPQMHGRFDALADELWFYKEQRSTYLAYWLLSAAAVIIAPMFRFPADIWSWLSLLFCAGVAFVSFVLWANAWAQIRRLRKLLSRIDPSHPL